MKEEEILLWEWILSSVITAALGFSCCKRLTNFSIIFTSKITNVICCKTIFYILIHDTHHITITETKIFDKNLKALKLHQTNTCISIWSHDLWSITAFEDISQLWLWLVSCPFKKIPSDSKFCHSVFNAIQKQLIPTELISFKIIYLF